MKFSIDVTHISLVLFKELQKLQRTVIFSIYSLIGFITYGFIAQSVVGYRRPSCQKEISKSIKMPPSQPACTERI